jgi:uncharacterized protein (DUF2237 family)
MNDMSKRFEGGGGGAKNVLGGPLQLCCAAPRTGFFRDGFCNTSAEDVGTHVICAVVTDEFLRYSQARGNDLLTPRPEYDFPGLREGDGWCLCALRWQEALEAGVAPKVKLESTHARALDLVRLEDLEANAASD